MQEIPKEVVQIISENGIGIVPTDTLYGIVGKALNKKTVERIYKLRKRNTKKPMIILISSLKELDFFGIKLTKEERKTLKIIWPDKISVIFSCCNTKWNYLHRGTKSLAFRIPAKKFLLKLLKKTGPLVVPSANFEGEKPAITIAEAKKYFGDKIEFYCDFGKLKSKPSTLVRLQEGKFEVLRKGEVKLKIP